MCLPKAVAIKRMHKLCSVDPIIRRKVNKYGEEYAHK